MSGFDDGATLAERMRRHAGANTHLYAELMRAMADDWEAGGPVREICRGWETAPAGSVIQLRLLAGAFRLVLTDRAPELVPYYPCLGGDAPAEQAWPAFRRVLVDHVGELQDALSIAPQTNEVGRSGALLAGLFEAVRRSGRRRVRLLEPGASAGLNLLVDKFRFEQPGWQVGPADSPVVITNVFEDPPQPRDFEVVERRGCDLAPVDAASAEGELRLRSFVWPFHLDRHERLVHACAVARRHPVTVDEAPAGEWLENQLAEPVSEDTMTVVWQSITRMYWPAAESARVDAAVAEAAQRQCVAHVSMEHSSGELLLPDLTLVGIGPDGRPSKDVATLASVGDHGIPVAMGRQGLPRSTT